MAQTKTQFGYRRHPDQDRAGANLGRTRRRRGGRGSGGAVAGDRSGAARSIRRAARRRRPDRRGLAGDLLFKTLARILGPARHRPAHGRQGRGVERRQDLSRRVSALSIQPAAGAGAQAAGLHQPAAILRRGLSGRSRRRTPCCRPALAQQGNRARTAQRPCTADDRNARRSVPAERPFRDRLRRRQILVAPDGGRGIRRAGVRGPVPDRRRQDDGGVSDRALVLVRSAVPCRPFRAAAQAARRHLADRPAAQSLCRSHGRKTAGERAAAHRPHAGARQVRFRMDLALQVPVPADEQIHPRPRHLCRRCRAPGFAVWRARRQFGARGRREFGVEARSRAAGNVARGAARELPYRAKCRRRREHPRIHPLDRFHGAQLPPGGAAAESGAVACQGDRVRQAHGERRTAVNAVELCDAALDRRWRFLARRPMSRHLDAGRAGCRRAR